MIRWGDFKSQVLNGLINQVQPVQAGTGLVTGAAATLDDAQALIWCRWGLAELSTHTADKASQTFVGDGATTQFVLADDCVDTLEKTGLLALSDGPVVNFIPPISFAADVVLDRQDIRMGWWEWPWGTINTAWVVPTNVQFTFSYYRVWTTPENDDAPLTIPRFLELPLAYLMVAYYSEAYALEYSKIRQWNRQLDAGTPLDNSMIEEIAHLRQMAMELLNRQAPQDRDRFHVAKGRGTGR